MPMRSIGNIYIAVSNYRVWLDALCGRGRCLYQCAGVLEEWDACKQRLMCCLCCVAARLTPHTQQSWGAADMGVT